MIQVIFNFKQEHKKIDPESPIRLSEEEIRNVEAIELKEDSIYYVARNFNFLPIPLDWRSRNSITLWGDLAKTVLSNI